MQRHDLFDGSKTEAVPAIHVDEQPQLPARKESDKNTENSECPQPQPRIWMRLIDEKDSGLVVDQGGSRDLRW